MAASNGSRPTNVVTVSCLITLVALSLIDALIPDFQIDKVVYAIVAGVLFGVGGIRDLLGAGRDDHDKK